MKKPKTHKTCGQYQAERIAANRGKAVEGLLSALEQEIIEEQRKDAEE